MTKIFESPDKGKTYTEREFTLQVPPPPEDLREKWAMDAYKKARRDRLTDVIGDYLTDEDTTVEELFGDLCAEVKTWSDYHRKFYDKTEKLLKFLSCEQDLGSLNSFSLGE